MKSIEERMSESGKVCNAKLTDLLKDNGKLDDATFDIFENFVENDLFTRFTNKELAKISAHFLIRDLIQGTTCLNK